MPSDINASHVARDSDIVDDTIHLGFIAAPAAGAGVSLGGWRSPYRGSFVRGCISLTTRGTVAGSTVVNVRNATKATDFYAAANRPAIGFDAGNGYLSSIGLAATPAVASAVQNADFDPGDEIVFSVETVSGAGGVAPTGLSVHMTVRAGKKASDPATP